MVIKFATKGESLGTRKLGEEIRNEIVSEINNNNKVIFDFDGVSIISNSFADECFGKLLNILDINEIKKKTSFTNTNSKVSLIIRKAFNDTIKSKNS